MKIYCARNSYSSFTDYKVIVQVKKIYTLAIVALLQACQNQDNKSTGTWSDVNKIQAGPILRDSLSNAQLGKVDYLVETFKEVDPTTRENWIEDFKKDQNPDREIEIWLMMAKAYTTYCEGKPLDSRIKKEVFKVILMRSSVSEDEVIKSMDLKYLSVGDAKQVMKAYTLAAKPIRVTDK
ncbi:hypothetical protein MTX78_06345 [Hymenobacter tibetensis]|uniref:Uncharacterized protein n=1 Tax=Hymenobacter tibetensis TaxID=497967 RepID=A0ABY4D1C4_9BACT|nr:hypothetical protein [Hymenobacter tibetensis]UOG76213.1 hypothetical protein MTX78_06345 [Hymenobacter tibetensis]